MGKTVSERRIRSRAKTLAKEDARIDPGNAKTKAKALLKESDERTNDPAVIDLRDDAVERRTSDDATPPIDV